MPLPNTAKPVILDSHRPRRAQRDTSSFEIPIHWAALYDKFFTVSTCPFWNSLPDNIKNVDKRDLLGVEVRQILLLRARGTVCGS
ncbi:hypothetical protein J6590_063948 [Homalodisca vitripennis]|nr:hypothetical protein J6590_063948 [Homalodisca vitripennis]